MAAAVATASPSALSAASAVTTAWAHGLDLAVNAFQHLIESRKAADGVLDLPLPESMKIDNRRAADEEMLKEHGANPAEARIIVLAARPFDDYPIPSPEYEKQIRRLAQSFGEQVSPSAPMPEVAAQARESLTEYRALAFRHGEVYYQTRFDRLIG